MRKWMFYLCIIGLLLSFPIRTKAEDELETKRMKLYQEIEQTANIPWYYFAAVDQYERNLRNTRKDLPDTEDPIGIYYTSRDWVGPLNLSLKDTDLLRIRLFGGIGKDGNNDGLANRKNGKDVLYTFANYLKSYGNDKENIKIGLWDYYEDEKTVDIIMGYAKIYQKFKTLKLDQHAFPMPLKFNYSYKNTWGDRRGWGGRRIHEGTDIFANYGVPVRATSYGIVELKGWNKYGGWRIGIRDLRNVYHYYGHLKGYEKGIKVGKVVTPGTVIGYVGSSGYGPKGTQGKFPPHLHYGMYRYNGYTEWSFDPYPYLKAWEQQDQKRKKKKD